jgi:excisionase family DNA binding protein
VNDVPAPRIPSSVRKAPRSTALDGSSEAGCSSPAEVLLTTRQVADRLATTERFPRRLIAERRIRFVRLGRHVRIPVSAVDELIAGGTVSPLGSAS